MATLRDASWTFSDIFLDFFRYIHIHMHRYIQEDMQGIHRAHNDNQQKDEQILNIVDYVYFFVDDIVFLKSKNLC